MRESKSSRRKANPPEERDDTPPPARFRVRDESGRRCALPLHPDRPTLFGRAPECDRRLQSRYFSRRHFLTIPTSEGYLLLDQRNGRGTLLEGERVRVAWLRDGAIVRAGPHLLRFRSGEDGEVRCPGCRRHLPGDSVGLCLVCRHRYPFLGSSVAGMTVEVPTETRLGLADFDGRLEGSGKAVRLRLVLQSAPRRILRRLRRYAHERAVRVLATGTHEGRIALVTTRPSSVTLRDLIQKHVHPPADLVDGVMQDTAMALAEAHRTGLVHGLLRPGSVGVSPEGTARVDDFGLRQLLPPETPAEADWFLPPERRVDSRRPETADDVYGFGATFYEVLTRRPPVPDFAHGSVDVTRRIPEIRPDLPERIARVIERCMARDPRDRYRRFDEIVADVIGD